MNNEATQHYIDPETGERKPIKLIVRPISADKPEGKNGLSPQEEQGLIAYLEHAVTGEGVEADLHAIGWAMRLEHTPLRSLPIGSKEFRDSYGEFIPRAALHWLVKQAGIPWSEADQRSILDLITLARDRRQAAAGNETANQERDLVLYEIHQNPDLTWREIVAKANQKHPDKADNWGLTHESARKSVLRFCERNPDKYQLVERTHKNRKPKK